MTAVWRRTATTSSRLTTCPNTWAPPGPLIGGDERVPETDLRGLLGDIAYRQIQTLRSFDDFAAVSLCFIADPALISFGLPPSFEPIIRLGTGAMVIGLMIDAPELGFVNANACLYEISSQGMMLADASVNVLDVAWRSVAAP